MFSSSMVHFDRRLSVALLGGGWKVGGKAGGKAGETSSQQYKKWSHNFLGKLMHIEQIKITSKITSAWTKIYQHLTFFRKKGGGARVWFRLR